jgi:hypothetical protein
VFVLLAYLGVIYLLLCFQRRKDEMNANLLPASFFRLPQTQCDPRIWNLESGGEGRLVNANPNQILTLPDHFIRMHNIAP